MRTLLIVAMLAFCACSDEAWATGRVLGRADAARTEAAKELKECNQTPGRDCSDAQRAYDTADYDRAFAITRLGQITRRDQLLMSGNVVYVVPLH